MCGKRSRLRWGFSSTVRPQFFLSSARSATHSGPRGLAIVVMNCQEPGWPVFKEIPRLSSVSITAWNGTAVIITEPENCRQRHCNKRKKSETVSSSASRPSDGLALFFVQGAKAKKSGPDLAPDQEDLGPREEEVVMSAALVLTGRVCSSLTKYPRRGLIGRWHTTIFHRPGKLGKPSCNSLPKRKRNLGRSEIHHRFGKNVPGPNQHG